MTRLLLMVMLALLFCTSQAMAGCVEMKSRIETKLQGKVITAYSLEIVPAAKPDVLAATPSVAESKSATAPKNGGQVIGSCEAEAGHMLLIYRRF